MSPNMVTTCMNDPGPIPNPAYDPVNNPSVPPMITDPNYNPQYSQFCYTFQYMPGVTTYLDTPVVPVAAFAGPNQQPLDCQDQDGTPVIWSVAGSMTGPYVSAPQPTGNNPYVADGTQAITITAAQDPQGLRDYGFGAGTTPGTVTIGGIPLSNVSWSELSITGTVTAGTMTGQLEVTGGDNGRKTLTGITVTVGGPAIQVAPGGSIQAAIDIANPGDLILVPTGEYQELVIMHTPVRLQGSGAGTVINAIKAPAEKLAQWRRDVETYYNQGRYGEIILSVDERLQIPTNVVDPGTPANDLQDLNDRSQILLDDGSNVENPLPLPPYIGLDNTLRAGDTTTNVIGALGYRLAAYQLMVSSHPDRIVAAGPGYTDVHVTRTAYQILFWLALGCAALVLANIRFRGWRLPAGSCRSVRCR